MDTACEDDWELCNDDGFVYKRKKRRQQQEQDNSPVFDPEADARHRKAQKKNYLLKIREKYTREIEMWEGFSASLNDMKEKNDEASRPSTLYINLSPQPLKPPENICLPLIDELLLQAEAQEVFLQELSKLCDVAEEMCKGQDEFLKQSFIDLPVWGTPQALMASLCDDEHKSKN
eukprot:TRINITY_DN15940_c0_g1_i1.p1 TRINITY_DN15940_c0_g1~~TRINITY_DN15940_c0_g1_i1.p1  ORF type:complete len:175 (+),score=42.11 TRINITY_DN15940_c0_g1_i1:137-661(+)